VEYVRTPAPANEYGAYGALFWLNAGGRYVELPRDMFWAAGNAGQNTIVIPSRDMVIVRLGHSTDGSDAYIEKVLTDILAAVRQ
jgi:CubicO group peptidase (beta-lactamase class C family)